MIRLPKFVRGASIEDTPWLYTIDVGANEELLRWVGRVRESDTGFELFSTAGVSAGDVMAKITEAVVDVAADEEAENDDEEDA